VGLYLERLRAEGADVFHDVPSENFNIDHVVLSLHGFFAVETKTRSNPTCGDARVALTEEGLLVNGFRPDRDPMSRQKKGLSGRDYGSLDFSCARESCDFPGPEKRQCQALVAGAANPLESDSCNCGVQYKEREGIRMIMRSASRATLTILFAATAIAAYSGSVRSAQSKSPSTERMVARGLPVAVDQIPDIKIAQTQDSEQQLATFQLQTACAREARAWFREHLSEGGGNLNSRGNSMRWSLVQYHYSLREHGCYAVVEIMTDLTGHNVSVVGEDLILYRVDGSQIGGVSASGGHVGADRGRVALKGCWLKRIHCSRLADWAALALPYVGNVDLSSMEVLLASSHVAK
jgi:Nuclease-related domain